MRYSVIYLEVLSVQGLMASIGVLLAILSGVCNGLFTAPMKLESRWRWENTWFVFIVVACLAMPVCCVAGSVANWQGVFAAAPASAIGFALLFGFAWGFGAICFGRSVEKLGVSLANSLVIGLSSALGSLVPLLLAKTLRIGVRETTLFVGILAFLIGVVFCGKAGRLRVGPSGLTPSLAGYGFAIAAGVMSAVFNIGYALALPIADAGMRTGHSAFESTNCIWLLMLAAGSIPNVVYCLYLMRRNQTLALLFAPKATVSWSLSIAMGLLWGGSIFLYGAATPKLGDIGPSIGWPLSLAVGLLVANLMGSLLGEWHGVSKLSLLWMRWGLVTLLVAISICAISTQVRG
jgi:L-rhamnose-H+ transport protein